MEDYAALIQRQLDAYNNKDIDAWLATYAPDARQYNLHGDCLAAGHDEMRARITARFKEPDLHARLISRTVSNNVVIDVEIITRNFPEGKGEIEMLCIYQIEGSLIQHASFSVGEPNFF